MGIDLGWLSAQAKYGARARDREQAQMLIEAISALEPPRAELDVDGRLRDAAADLRNSLEEILDYRGGASSALEDDHVMERARAAIARAAGGAT